LFPHWRGRFDGSRPSLAGLEGDRIIGALEGGLLTENEISGLLHLIREPDVCYFFARLRDFFKADDSFLVSFFESAIAAFPFSYQLVGQVPRRCG
jgi:hypothetical protein